MYVVRMFVFFVAFPFSRCDNGTALTFLNTPELLLHWGFDVESHSIKTADNYILTMHRIPNPKSKYYPVVVQHGILLASDSWVLRGPKKDLVLLLAEEGFDIWLANTRGNYYSRNHASYQRIHKTFWNFGWDELGMYDIPAMIDYVLRRTCRKTVIHMGHSMGTTSFYVMLSKMPDMNRKIHAHISLAPVAFMNRMRCLEVLRPIAYLAKQLVDFQNFLGLYDFFKRDVRISKIVWLTCKKPRNKKLCYKLMFYFIGPDYNQLNEECFERYLGHFPSGASSGMFVHFVQNALAKEFREFDYGKSINIKKYGTSVPPHYNLSRVTAPVYLYYSTNDYLSHHLDVERLAKRLPNVKKKYLVPYKYFNHMDYIWAKDSKNLVYDDIIKTLKTFVVNSSDNRLN